MGDRNIVDLTITTGEAESMKSALPGGDFGGEVDSIERQILEATGQLLSKWGIGKTTVADIAREAGCSRATVYRVFPGGKQELIKTVGESELQTFFGYLAKLANSADTLEDALVDVVTASHRILSNHQGFQQVLEQEPGLMLPYLGFHRIDRLYATVRERLSPHFERFLCRDPEWAVEWVARISLSYLFQPSTDTDMSDPVTVRNLIHTRVMPGLIEPASDTTSEVLVST